MLWVNEVYNHRITCISPFFFYVTGLSYQSLLCVYPEWCLRNIFLRRCTFVSRSSFIVHALRYRPYSDIPRVKEVTGPSFARMCRSNRDVEFMEWLVWWWVWQRSWPWRNVEQDLLRRRRSRSLFFFVFSVALPPVPQVLLSVCVCGFAVLLSVFCFPSFHSVPSFNSVCIRVLSQSHLVSILWWSFDMYVLHPCTHTHNMET